MLQCRKKLAMPHCSIYLKFSHNEAVDAAYPHKESLP